MTEILTEAKSKAASEAPQANLYAFFRHLGASSTTDFTREGGIVRWNAPLSHPWFQGVLCENPAGRGSDNVIGECEAYFRAAGAQGFSWWLDLDVRGTGWEELLAARGFTYDNNTPGMAVDLGQLPEPSQPEGFRIDAVTDATALSLWARTCAEAYGMPAEAGGLMDQTMQGIGLELPLRNYLGFLDDQPIATSSLFLGAGVAGIYTVGTLAAARGRGIGAAVTLAPLYEARAMGYRIGVLQSSEMGFSVYEGMGFRTTRQIDNYYLALG
jgi:ribosomal protein S18 acetylase RimI-like enzyme